MTTNTQRRANLLFALLLFWKNQKDALASDRKQEGESYEKRK